MKVSDNPQAWLRPRIAKYRGAHRPRQHRGQMEPAIEVIPRRGGVAASMITQLDGLMALARGTIEVGQHPLDPARSWRRSCCHCAHRRGTRRQLHEAAQTPRRVAFGHGQHGFVRDQPRRVAGRVPMTCPLQHRQIRLGRPGRTRGQRPCDREVVCLEATCRRSETAR